MLTVGKYLIQPHFQKIQTVPLRGRQIHSGTLNTGFKFLNTFIELLTFHQLGIFNYQLITNVQFKQIYTQKLYSIQCNNMEKKHEYFLCGGYA